MASSRIEISYPGVECYAICPSSASTDIVYPRYSRGITPKGIPEVRVEDALTALTRSEFSFNRGPNDVHTYTHIYTAFYQIATRCAQRFELDTNIRQFFCENGKIDDAYAAKSATDYSRPM